METAFTRLHLLSSGRPFVRRPKLKKDGHLVGLWDRLTDSAKRLRDFFRPPPSLPPRRVVQPQRRPPRPPAQPSPPTPTQRLVEPQRVARFRTPQFDTRNTHNTIGYPPYMWPEEARQLHTALQSLPPGLANQFVRDDRAMRGFHDTYFGFKGDEDGDGKYTRNWDAYKVRRVEFLTWVFSVYGINFEQDMPIDWDLLRAISGAQLMQDAPSLV